MSGGATSTRCSRRARGVRRRRGSARSGRVWSAMATLGGERKAVGDSRTPRTRRWCAAGRAARRWARAAGRRRAWRARSRRTTRPVRIVQGGPARRRPAAPCPTRGPARLAPHHLLFGASRGRDGLAFAAEGGPSRPTTRRRFSPTALVGHLEPSTNTSLKWRRRSSREPPTCTRGRACPPEHGQPVVWHRVVAGPGPSSQPDVAVVPAGGPHPSGRDLPPPAETRSARVETAERSERARLGEQLAAITSARWILGSRSRLRSSEARPGARRDDFSPTNTV